MSETNAYQGRDPYELLAEAEKARPIASGDQESLDSKDNRRQEPVILIDNLGGLENWNDTMRGREMG